MGALAIAHSEPVTAELAGFMRNEMGDIRLRVESLNPTISAEETVEQLKLLAPELSAFLSSRHPGVSVEAEREKSIPIDPATAYLVLTFIGKGIAAGVLSKLGQDAYTFLKSKIRNASIDPPDDEA
jgi:hypothetical protein